MKVTRIRSERNSRKTKVAAYVRVSTEDDSQEGSFENQAKYYEDKIRANPDWDFAGVYGERMSGTHVENREEFKRLVRDARDRKVDIILCKSVSRWARNTIEGLENIKEINGAGAKVIFESEGIDTSMPGSTLQLNLAAAVAQMESVSISENMKWTYRNRAAQGKFVAARGRYFGFNTDDHNFTPDGNAKYVKMIFDDYLSGMSCEEIAGKLNGMGVKNSRGREWSRGSIRGILHNEVYVGDVRFQKTPARDVITGEIDEIQATRYISDHHKGIVDRRTWDRAQKVKGGRRRKAE